MSTLTQANEYWQEVQGEIGEFDLAIVIPAYNEEARILPYLEEIQEYCKNCNQRVRTIVVNDGSIDNTVNIVEQFSKANPDFNIILHSLEKNSGKGAALKAGFLRSRAKFVLLTDADGSTPISEVERLQAKITDVAIASRAKPSDEVLVETNWLRLSLGRCFNFIVNLTILPGLYDTQCGFKLFSAEAAHKLFFLSEVTGFGFDLEILYLAKKLGFNIEEVPVNWHNVPGSKVNLLADAIKMFTDILLIRKRWRVL